MSTSDAGLQAVRDDGSTEWAAVQPSVIAQRIGLRRVDWVRLLIGQDSVSAEAVGVGYRIPVNRRISMASAVALMDAGIPCVRKFTTSERTSGVRLPL